MPRSSYHKIQRFRHNDRKNNSGTDKKAKITRRPVTGQKEDNASPQSNENKEG
jgi:hypothetical protein